MMLNFLRSTSLHRQIHDLVFLIQKQPLRRDGRFRNSPSHDGDAMARMDEMRRSPIDDDLAGATRSSDDVGFEALTARDGGDEHLFSVPQIGTFHQIERDGDAAFIVDVGIGDAGAVELGFEEVSEHSPECRDASRGQGTACLAKLKKPPQEKKTFSAVPRSIQALSEALRKSRRSRMSEMESR